MKIAWPRWRDRLFKPGLALRPAVETDLDHLCLFYENCMRRYAEAFDPWDPDKFRNSYNPKDVEILNVSVKFAGLLKTQFFDDHVYLADIQLIPEIRNRGIGTQLVKLTIERANALDLPIRLRVLRNNPAKSLYERLGFRKIDEARTHFVFERKS